MQYLFSQTNKKRVLLLWEMGGIHLKLCEAKLATSL